jgi:protein-S-isoprenylcysteine O-methyltransferase Ste14
MFYYLIPLMIGFSANLASAFTTAFSRRWGDRRGTLVTIILRNILGIPVWGVGFWMAARARSPDVFTPMTFTTAIGWILTALGGLVIILALVAIRWRAAAPARQDALVEHGLYARVRHPIHSGAQLEFLGLFLMIPSLTVALASLLGMLWVFLQTRLEEHDLLQRLPGYDEYMKRVPRFIPRLR